MRGAGTATRSWLAVAALGALVGGCRTYEARPVDLGAHRVAFLSRTPESPEVEALAAGLRERGGGGAAFDLRDGVSLEEGESIAMVFNADLRVARLRAGVARAAAENSGLWQDPVLGVDVARIVESVEEPWEGAVGLGFTIPVSGRTALGKEQAGLEHAAELARVAEQEWRVRMDLRRAWSRWSALRAAVEASREYARRLEQIVGVVGAVERAGELSRVEARPARIEHAARKAELELLESQAEEAALEVCRLMGLSPTAASALLPAPLGGTGEDDAGGDELMTSPLVAAARAEYEAAEKALELAVRRQYPDVTVGPGVGQDDGENQVRLGISVPIPLFNANRREIAEAEAAREAARGACEATVERLVSELRAARSRLAAARRRRETLEREVLPLAEDQYADARRAIELGEAPAHAALDALSRRHEVVLRVIEAARDETLAAVRVAEILGPKAKGGGP